MRKLLFIAGKRKAGTTFLFHALQTDFKPDVKDRTLSETMTFVEEFRDGDQSTGVVAKADAIYMAKDVLAALSDANLPPGMVEFVVLDRTTQERALSFLAHARKQKWVSLSKAWADFHTEETRASEGLALLREAGTRVTEISYEALASGDIPSVCGIPLKAVERRRNSRGEILPFFGVISRIAEKEWYLRLRETRTLMALKRLYYRSIAGSNSRKNGFVRTVVLGSVAGPPDGQRRITGIFAKNSSFAVQTMDFNGHRKWWGLAKIAMQTFQSVWLALFGRIDVVYLAISRTNFGLIRDWLLLTPLRLSGARVVAHVHGAEFEKFYFDDPTLASLKARQLHQVDCFLFIHEALLPLRSDIADRSFVLRNPIPNLSELSGDEAPVPVEERMRMGFISSFVPGKGLEDYLTLADHIGARGAFPIAGGVHPKFPAYGKEALAKVQSRPSLTYLGYVKDPARFYRQTDLMIFPTSYVSEALPSVVLEALDFGCLPVIRRSNHLPTIFADAPVVWFDTSEELMVEVEAQLSRGVDAVRAEADVRRKWVRESYPTEVEWVARLEAHMLNVPPTPAPAEQTGLAIQGTAPRNAGS